MTEYFILKLRRRLAGTYETATPSLDKQLLM